MKNMSVEVLKKAFDNICHYMNEQNISSIELDRDYYWEIDCNQRYDMDRVPAVSDVGQLFDDWNEIERMAKDEDGIVSYDIIWFASVCRFIGEKMTR